MPKQLRFSDQMRRLIVEAGQSQYQIAKATGIHKASLSRFVNRKRSLSQEHLDTLAAYLGWTVIAKGK